MAIWEAEDFIRSFIGENWSSYAVSISIDCDIPIDELRSIGLLPEFEGFQACRRLVRVPVIHEEVAASLWKKLAEAAKEDAAARRSAEQAGCEEGEGEETANRNTRRQKQQKRQKRREASRRGRCAYCHNNCTPFDDNPKTYIGISHRRTISSNTVKFFARTAKKNKKAAEEPGFWQQPTPTKRPSSSRSMSWPMPSWSWRKQVRAETGDRPATS
ncbi:hypothetical protein VTK26DRAFT_4720 [Humicola hyalothermophila]